MKKKIHLKRIFHRDKWRIAIMFDYDEKLKASVKSIRNVTYSQTHRCFYLDDNEDNLKLIFSSMKNIADIDISSITCKEESVIIPVPSTGSETSDRILQQKDNQTFRSNNFSYSSMNNKKQYQDPYVIHGQKSVKATVDRFRFAPVEFRISEKEGLLIIKFLGQYDPAWIDELKTYGRCFYDKKRREWLLPWSKLTCDSLADYFASRGIELNIKKQIISDTLKVERKDLGDEIRSRHLGLKAMEDLELMARHLEDNRFSPRTRESYMAVLEFFFRYFSSKDPTEITEGEITSFIHEYIIKLGYSASYQNQIISAIKTFYTISGKGKINPEVIERPRRSRALPKVLSKDEVSRILNSSRNIKHKLLANIISSLDEGSEK
jgi:hypothetical protein